MSFVWGAENVAFLRKRFEAMSAHHCYHGMEYTEDRSKIAEWAPLIMEGRDDGRAGRRDADHHRHRRRLRRADPPAGCSICQPAGFAVHYRHQRRGSRPRARRPLAGGRRGPSDGTAQSVTAKFVFIGAGGGALPLLQKSGIPEGRGYGGFPVSGIWLRCDDPAVSERHHAKVYGKAARFAADVGAAPRHADHRRPDLAAVRPIRRLLQQVPEARLADRPVRVDHAGNIVPLLDVARDNFDLTEYLIGQLLQSRSTQFAALQAVLSQGRRSDWKEAVAGQRVQIIKPDMDKGGLAGVRHRTRGGGGQVAGGAARRLAGASTAAFIATRCWRSASRRS